MAPQLIVQEGRVLNLQTLVADWQLKNPKLLKIEVRDSEFDEIFIVREKFTGPTIGLMYRQRNHAVLAMFQGLLNFPQLLGNL